MKNKYVKPQIEFLEFDYSSTIAASGDGKVTDGGENVAPLSTSLNTTMMAAPPFGSAMSPTVTNTYNDAIADEANTDTGSTDTVNVVASDGDSINGNVSTFEAAGLVVNTNENVE